MRLKLTLLPVYVLIATLLNNIQYVAAQANPISLHPENPHYFFYKNKPVILITSGEHYGSVLNPDFNYTAYLDELAGKGLNLTRTFTGAYVEPSNAFNISSNTMSPAAGKLLCPWMRSNEPGYAAGGNKFDLNKWDDTYFKRLKNFVHAAGQRGIIVELAFFCPFYEDTLWHLSPVYIKNNINHLGDVLRNDVYTLDKNGGLLAIQEKLVQKIVRELKDCGNLVYEICNEPYFGGVTMQWQHHIADIITEAEKAFSAKHIITQNIANGFAKIENPYPSVAVFNFHYAWPPVTVAMNYGLNKVLGDNETGFRGNSDSTYRMEGWRFILAGGGLYNNLDYSFAVGHEKGDYHYPSTQPGGGSDSLRKQLSYLKKFIEGFDFLKMSPDSNFIISGLPVNVASQVLSQKGKQYAAYFYGGTKLQLDVNLPKGSYEAVWMNTLTGEYLNKETLRSNDKKIALVSPLYKEDIALKIIKKN